MITNIVQSAAEVLIDILIVIAAWVVMSVPAVLEARNGVCQAPEAAEVRAP